MQYASGYTTHDLWLGEFESGLRGLLVVAFDCCLDALDVGSNSAAARAVDFGTALVAADPLLRRVCVGHELVPNKESVWIARVLMPQPFNVKTSLCILELRFAFFDESSHTFFLIYRTEPSLE